MGSSGIILSSGPHRLLRERWESQRQTASTMLLNQRGGKRLTCSLGFASAQMLCPVTHPTLSPHSTPQSRSELLPVPAFAMNLMWETQDIDLPTSAARFRDQAGLTESVSGCS